MLRNPVTLTLPMDFSLQFFRDLRIWVQNNTRKEMPVTGKKLGYTDGIVWWWGAGTVEKDSYTITLFFKSETDKLLFILGKL